MSDNNDPMAEIRASFFIECEELLEALQDGLQAMYDGADDSETINVVFRAVHSIKGGAGAFGLEVVDLFQYILHGRSCGKFRLGQLVTLFFGEVERHGPRQCIILEYDFAHRFETIMDEVRAGRMTPDADALKLFFSCADHLSDLVRISRDDGDLPQDETDKLLSQLDEMLGQDAGSSDAQEHEEDIDFQPATLSLDLDFGGDADIAPPMELDADAAEAGKTFAISFKPETELFETGNEPFLMLRALDEMGTCTVTCNTDAVPELAELAPETSYLSWSIELTTEPTLGISSDGQRRPDRP